MCRRRIKKDKENKEDVKLDDAKKEEVIDNAERENLLLYKTQGGLEIDEVYSKCFLLKRSFYKAKIFSLKSTKFQIRYWPFMIQLIRFNFLFK